MDTESASQGVGSYQVVSVKSIDADSLCALYDSVGWSVYASDKERLLAAIEGSDFVVIAQETDALIGLARAISDDASVVYIQDILVRPTHQGRGIGKALVRAVLDRFKHVRQKVLLTDNRPEQLQFYGSLGFKNTRDLVRTPLNAFVIIEGTELT